MKNAAAALPAAADKGHDSATGRPSMISIAVPGFTLSSSGLYRHFCLQRGAAAAGEPAENSAKSEKLNEMR
jgi:hypothetical protein